MKKCIVTGGAGFIGSNIARRLIESGYQVFILDDLSTGFERNIPAGAEFIRLDVSDPKACACADLPETIDVVYHIAAQPSGEASFEDPTRDCDVNYKATYNMLELSRRKCAGRFLFASSMSVYGEVNEDNFVVSEKDPPRPSSYYGCHKLSSENIIRIAGANSGLDTTCFRLFNVYGYNQNMHNMKQGMVSIYMSYLLNNQPVHVKGSLDRFRDFIFVDDVVEAFIKSEKEPATFGGVYNLGTGIKTTVEELLQSMLKVYGKDDFAKWVYSEGFTAGDIKGCVADINAIKKVLDWQPRYTVTRGIQEMKVWVDETIDLWRAEVIKS
ncbi:MAG: NAD-dependent epimerase/dehydratase family protein [Candidatus Omnitrophota bacterium]